MTVRPKEAVLCWLATVDAAGRPNVSPKEVFAQFDDGPFVIAEIASARSLRNIRACPRVCVSLIDIFDQRGRKIEGHAEAIAPDDPRFAALVAPLEVLTGGAFPIRHVLAITPERETEILAPSYALRPDESAAEKRAGVLRTYGVKEI